MREVKILVQSGKNLEQNLEHVFVDDGRQVYVCVKDEHVVEEEAEKVNEVQYHK